MKKKIRKPRPIKVWDRRCFVSVMYAYAGHDLIVTGEEARKLAAWLLKAAQYLEQKNGH